jgi:hypothetical protein
METLTIKTVLFAVGREALPGNINSLCMRTMRTPQSYSLPLRSLLPLKSFRVDMACKRSAAPRPGRNLPCITSILLQLDMNQSGKELQRKRVVSPATFCYI